MSRVAVLQLGAAWVRVAVEDPRPRLLAALPVRDADPLVVLRTGLPALLDRPADQLVVVHTRGAPPMIPPTVAAAVRSVPAAVAALGSAPARPDAVGRSAVGESGAERGGGGVLDAVVVDVGHSGAEIARVAGGRVVVACRVPVGGAVLDDDDGGVAPRRGRDPACGPIRPPGRDPGGTRAAVAAADGADRRAARRTARRCAPGSVVAPHLAAVVDAVRTVRLGAGPGRSPPVLLIGGMARMPLLAELLDAAGVPAVRVAARPDSAAVVGALRLPPDLLGPSPVPNPLEPAGSLAEPGARGRPAAPSGAGVTGARVSAPADGGPADRSGSRRWRRSGDVLCADWRWVPRRR